MKNLFLIAVIFLAMSCREEVINDPPMDQLYLKSASADEEKVVCSTKTETYRLPNDVLAKIPAYENTVEILNNPLLSLNGSDYKITNGKVIFSVIDNNSMITEVEAIQLPFLPGDYQYQTETGNTMFNGILKSDTLVFAINVLDSKIKIKVFNLNTNKIVTDNIASVQNGALTFKINNEIWKIWLSKISPRGNIFQMFNLNKGGATSICYSLYLTK